jgi:hypothetical protein
MSEPMDITKPYRQPEASQGRIVLYTYAPIDLPDGFKHLAGASRPAIVVRVWKGEYKYDDGSQEPGYNLQVFTDGFNDGFLLKGNGVDAANVGIPFVNGVLWKRSVRMSSEPIAGTCHWPPR